MNDIVPIEHSYQTFHGSRGPGSIRGNRKENPFGAAEGSKRHIHLRCEAAA